MQASAATHPGSVRAQNQDACLCRPELGLFAVADGVGGHGNGDIASRAVTEALAAMADAVSPAARLEALRAALKQAHVALLELAAAQIADGPIATTVVVLLLHADHFACLWVGDSRAYLLRDGVLCPLTSDHSVVQDLVDAGELTESEAGTDPRRHIITRAIGAGEGELRVDKAIGQVLAGDRFLLCSDGLHKTIEADRIVHILGATDDPARHLIDVALSCHVRDNVTAVVIGA